MRTAKIGPDLRLVCSKRVPSRVGLSTPFQLSDETTTEYNLCKGISEHDVRHLFSRFFLGGGGAS